MLSPDEIERIRAEERLRQEIRDALAPPPEPPRPRTRSERLWDGMNSKFGMWFLSSVVLSAVLSGYTTLQEHLKEKSRERQVAAAEDLRIKHLQERINLEIAYRLSTALTELRNAHVKFADRVDDDAQMAIRKALTPLAASASERFPSLYPEFTALSGIALIADLRRTSKGAGEEGLKEVLVGMTAAVNDAKADAPSLREPAQTVASKLLRIMEGKPWDEGFPFNDCKPSKPFC